MSEEISATAREEVTKAEGNLRRGLGQVRVDRADANLLNRIQVEYYDVPTPVNQLAGINIPEARVLMTTSFDKNSIADIEKATRMSDTDISSANDEDTTRLVIPQLTEGRQKKLTRDVKKEAENSEVVIRSVRCDAIDELKKAQKNGDITRDELRSSKKGVQKLANDNIKNTDAVIAGKEQKLLEI